MPYMEEMRQGNEVENISARQKTLLLCGNGKSGEAIPLIKVWGYRVCLISEFPNDNCIDDVDQYVYANSMDPEAALIAAKKLVSEGWEFDGVISLCWDCPISVAIIAKELGLPSIPVTIAEVATFKDKRIKTLRDAGIPVPESITVPLEQSTKFDLPFSYPVVSKPVDLSGSVGVFLARGHDELLEAFSKTAQYLVLSKMKSIQIEQYIDGTEYSVEGLVLNGLLHITGTSERVFIKNYLPVFVERGDIIPANLTKKQITDIKCICQDSIDALGIDSGAAKFDIKIDSNGKIFVFEVTPRLGGPRFGTEMIPLANGTSILRALISQACGLPVDITWLQPNKNQTVVAFNIFAPKNGRIVSLKGLEIARSITGVYDFKWSRPSGFFEGDIVKDGQELGYYIIYANSRSSALDKARRFEDLFEIEVGQ